MVENLAEKFLNIQILLHNIYVKFEFINFLETFIIRSVSHIICIKQVPGYILIL